MLQGNSKSPDKFAKHTPFETLPDGEHLKLNQQYTVFLVEDDPDDRAQAISVLQKSPYIYNVHSFESGDQLIAHFVGEGYYAGSSVHGMPKLILLDLHLPGTSGMEVLRDLKEHPLTKNIPVIMITGDASNKPVLEAYQLEANAYLPKPLKLGNVHDVIYNGWGWPTKKPTPE